MKKRLLAIIAAFSMGLTACNLSGGGDSTAYDTLCVNPLSQIRYPEMYCTPGLYYHPSWVYYVPYGYVAPPVNGRVQHYSHAHFNRPSSGVIHTGGVPTKGGKAPKITTGKGVVNLNKGSTDKGSVNKGGSNKGGGGYKPLKPQAPRPVAPKPAKPF